MQSNSLHCASLIYFTVGYVSVESASEVFPTPVLHVLRTFTQHVWLPKGGHRKYAGVCAS